MKKSILCAAALLLPSLIACNAPSSGTPGDASPLAASSQETPASAQSTAIPPTAATPPVPVRTFHTDALLFVGDGTWSTEVANLRTILNTHRASFDEVTSSEMNAMSLDALAGYGVIVFPGGAGAFIAQAPAPSSGGDVSYGLGIVDGPVLDYYYLETQDQKIAMTLYTFADESTADILYYGGPVTPNVPGGIVAKYPNGDPSISEMWSGKGLVLIAGGHPTANAATLSALGVSSSDGTHQDVAWNMIEAGIKQKPLPAFN